MDIALLYGVNRSCPMTCSVHNDGFTSDHPRAWERKQWALLSINLQEANQPFCQHTPRVVAISGCKWGNKPWFNVIKLI